MSFINLNWYIALAFCLIFFIGGRQLAEFQGENARGNTRAGFTLKLILFAFALPSLLFPLAYLPDAISASPWYNTFRSINRIELFSSLIAPAAGYSTYRKPANQYGVRRAQNSSPMLGVLKPLAFPFCLILISVNFVGPIMRPLSKEISFTDAWTEDGVYLQTIPATAGPSALISAMYLLNYFADAELDVAKNTYTDRAGTEFWYLARYAVNKGYRTKFIKPPDIEGAPFPSIVSVARVKAEDGEDGVGDRAGSYIILIKRSEDGVLTIGDPAAGKLEMNAGEYRYAYGDPALALAISAPRDR